MKTFSRAARKALLYGVLIVIAALWTVPTLGLLITSFRPGEDANSTGWWTVLQNPAKANLTLDNYRVVLSNGKDPALAGVVKEDEQNVNLFSSFLNSVTVTVPATVIPI